jgi:hypothetical protein
MVVADCVVGVCVARRGGYGVEIRRSRCCHTPRLDAHLANSSDLPLHFHRWRPACVRRGLRAREISPAVSYQPIGRRLRTTCDCASGEV